MQSRSAAADVDVLLLLLLLLLLLPLLVLRIDLGRGGEELGHICGDVALVSKPLRRRHLLALLLALWRLGLLRLMMVLLMVMKRPVP